uniref:(northern house mosquito) hypothetical protein n=1 Tax=Culex pipiens TaxID=7175 RepID=A0A8D8APF8_CULPI
MDAPAAFLQENLDEEIYMEQHLCFSDGKQKKFRLAPTKNDPYVYLSKNDGNILIVAIYVDDLIEIRWLQPPHQAQRHPAPLDPGTRCGEVGVREHGQPDFRWTHEAVAEDEAGREPEFNGQHLQGEC